MTNIILNIFDGMVLRMFYLIDTFCLTGEGIILQLAFNNVFPIWKEDF